MSDQVIEMYFDYASPFSYVADMRIDGVMEDLPVTVRRVPVYLRDLEADETSPARAEYLARDLDRCARFHGVPLGTPAVTPINGLYLLRGYLFLAGREQQAAYHAAALRATWVAGANVSDPEVVANIAASVGLDRGEFATGIGTPAVKQQLRANTERARERGAFGVPTFFVGDEMFWGQDRLDYVRRQVEQIASSVVMMSDPDDA